MKFKFFHWHWCPRCFSLWSCSNLACHDFKWHDIECPECQFNKYGYVIIGK